MKHGVAELKSTAIVFLAHGLLLVPPLGAHCTCTAKDVFFGRKFQSKSYIQHLKIFQKYIRADKCFIELLHHLD
jgi:hypothetical protein